MPLDPIIAFKNQPTEVRVIPLSSLTVQTVTTADVISAVGSGADPTGAADATANIQAALNSCPPGGTVYLAAGTYTTSAPLQIPTGVVLKGSHGNMLSLTDYGSVIRPSASWAQGSAPASAVILINGGEEQQVSDLMIDGSQLPVTADGLSVYGAASNVKLTDLNIRNVTGNGLSNTGSSGTTVRALRITVHRAGNIGITCNITDSTFIDCLSIGSGAQGWYLGNGNANSKLIGCRAEWSGTEGFQFAGAWNAGNGAGGLQFIGCSTDRNGHNGVLINATGNSPILISGLMTRRDGSASSSAGYAGLQIAGNGTVPVIVDGMTCFPGVNDDGTGNDSPQYGINAGGTPTYFAVTNAYLHAVSAGVNGAIMNFRALATRAGSTSSPGSITQVADNA